MKMRREILENVLYPIIVIMTIIMHMTSYYSNIKKWGTQMAYINWLPRINDRLDIC